MQVIANGDKGQQQEHVVAAGALVLAQDVEDPDRVVRPHSDAAVGVLVEEIKETVGGVGVMARVGEQAELAMEEYDGISSREEVFGTGSTTGTGREVLVGFDSMLAQGFVEADCILIPRGVREDKRAQGNIGHIHQ